MLLVLLNGIALLLGVVLGGIAILYGIAYPLKWILEFALLIWNAAKSRWQRISEPPALRG